MVVKMEFEILFQQYVVCISIASIMAERENLWMAGHRFTYFSKDVIKDEDVKSHSAVLKHVCPVWNSPRVIIVVNSAVSNSNKRVAIRQTWAKNSYGRYEIKVVFLIGLSTEEKNNMLVRKENVMYNDVIIANLMDTYANLSLKTVYCLKWLTTNCAHVPYVMKCDDDVYINTKNLAALIPYLPRKIFRELLIGKTNIGNKPIRNPDSKWFMPYDLYKDDVYPNYLSGVGYLMSMPAAKQLYNVAKNVPLIYLEDVFITGIVANLAGIPVRSKYEFHYHHGPLLGHAICKKPFSSLVLICHYAQWYHMYQIHRDLEKCDPSDNSAWPWWYIWSLSRSWPGDFLID